MHKSRSYKGKVKDEQLPLIWTQALEYQFGVLISGFSNLCLPIMIGR